MSVLILDSVCVVVDRMSISSLFRESIFDVEHGYIAFSRSLVIFLGEKVKANSLSYDSATDEAHNISARKSATVKGETGRNRHTVKYFVMINAFICASLDTVGLHNYVTPMMHFLRRSRPC